jgi:integrase
MVRGHGKKRLELPTYLPEVLDLCWRTGRRIAAVLALRFEDLRLAEGPHGSVLWPASSDKMGKEWLVPMSPEARLAIDNILAERPGIGEGSCSRHSSRRVKQYVRMQSPCGFAQQKF